MPPKRGKKGKGGKKGRKPKGPRRRRLKKPKFSRFDIRLLYTEFMENFHKCDRDAAVLQAIPLEHLGKAMRMCGLMPSEKLVSVISERIEKQDPYLTPEPSDDEEEEEEDDVPWLEEELEILMALQKGQDVGEIIREQKRLKFEKEEEQTSKELEEKEAGEKNNEREKRKLKKRSKRKSRRQREEEEEQRKLEEEEAERLRLEEEEAEKIRLEEEEEAERLRLEEEELKKKKPKRELKWPYAKKKEEIKKVAKMRIRFKHFCKWEEFVKVIELYWDRTQYDGQDVLWAFMTMDPKWDYELEPVWPYGAEEPLVPTDEIDNEIVRDFVQNKQDRFIEKETRRFIRMADFKKETFFNYKELISDFSQEANYNLGVAKKKKKMDIKET